MSHRRSIHIPRGSFLRGPAGFLEDFLRLPIVATDKEHRRSRRPCLQVFPFVDDFPTIPPRDQRVLEFEPLNNGGLVSTYIPREDLDISPSLGYTH